MARALQAILTYFPLRYYLVAMFFSFIFLSQIETITAFEEAVTHNALELLNIDSYLSSKGLYVRTTNEWTSFPFSVVAQLLFIIFFPTIAITSRTNFKILASLLMFGLLCLVLFMALHLLMIMASFVIEPLQSRFAFWVVSVTGTILIGGLIIELALFSTIRIPKPTQIRPMLRRSYAIEYAILAIVLIGSSAMLYFIIQWLGLDAYSSESRAVDFVHLGFWLNMPIIITFSYYISNILYEIKRPVQLYKAPENNITEKPFSVTFLIPAYNEEKLIKRCIESIDRAAAKYPGKVDIVVINDGSKDHTEQIVGECMQNLKFSTGQFYTIPNSGKGYALAYGLDKTSGDIIFRTDADSILDENALTPMMSHFRNPEVGSVSAWVMPFKGGSRWVKTQNVLFSHYFYTKRGQEMVDAILAQPGSSTAFRRELVEKAGGWVNNIFGEDGEITNRVGRLGYRGVFEGDSIVYSELPETLLGFMQQRTRWSVAFFHSRGRNIRLTREFRNSRFPVFLWNLLSHGISLGKGLLWPYMATSLIMGMWDMSTPEAISVGSIITKLLGIQAAVTALSFILYSYRLYKIGRLNDMKYFPVVRFLVLVLNWIVKPQAVEVLLTWSARWKQYNDESFRDLRKEVHKSVDPLYPAGDDQQETTTISEKDTVTQIQRAPIRY
jgi:cellulose synthase/poly-beta-1,6-N-acetylglucosamine synthase-like glycosyltransferase